MLMKRMRCYNFIVYVVLAVFLFPALTLMPTQELGHSSILGEQSLTSLGCVAREIAENRLRETTDGANTEENISFIGWRRLLRTGMTGGLLLATGFFTFFGELLQRIIRRRGFDGNLRYMTGISYHIGYMEDTDGEKGLRTA